MDNRYYYRLLGLSGESSPEKIQAAYESRMEKLHSSDYADDPVYAKKKMAEVTMAYNVLTGKSAPVSRGQKKAAFEKFKDFIEDREGNDTEEELHDYDDFRAERKTQKKSTRAKVSRAKRMRREPAGDRRGSVPYGAGERRSSGKRKYIVVAVIFLVIFAITFSAAALINGALNYSADYNDSFFDDLYTGLSGDDYEYGGYTTSLTASEMDQADRIRESAAHIEYYDMLDTATISDNYDYITWDEGVDQYANGELLDHLYDLVYSFGIYDVTGFLDYITGIEDYFFDYDDADCATAVVIYMGAPAFEEIAGSEDLSTGEAILTYSDYIQFLERVSYDFLQI